MKDIFEGNPADVTLKEAKDWLKERVNDGAHCPCCSQHAKIYRRHINSSMAYVLICVERYFRQHNDWLHVAGFLAGMGLTPRAAAAMRGDFAKLKYWGLLKPKSGIRDDGSGRNGYYHITDAGIAYVQGRLEVPKYAHVYDEQVLRMSGPNVTIRDALRKRFNYDELMSTAGTGLPPI